MSVGRLGNAPTGPQADKEIKNGEEEPAIGPQVTLKNPHRQSNGDPRRTSFVGVQRRRWPRGVEDEELLSVQFKAPCSGGCDDGASCAWRKMGVATNVIVIYQILRQSRWKIGILFYCRPVLYI